MYLSLGRSKFDHLVAGVQGEQLLPLYRVEETRLTPVLKPLLGESFLGSLTNRLRAKNINLSLQWNRSTRCKGIETVFVGNGERVGEAPDSNEGSLDCLLTLSNLSSFQLTVFSCLWTLWIIDHPTHF